MECDAAVVPHPIGGRKQKLLMLDLEERGTLADNKRKGTFHALYYLLAELEMSVVITR